MTIVIFVSSRASDGSHLRDACATLLDHEAAPETTRRIVRPSPGSPCPPEIGGSY
jgi:hypothetical protein